jgi:hypothetical protein
VPEQPRDFALVIGLDDYPNFGAGGRPLKGAINDARGFAEWVKDSTTGGGVPTGNCELVLSTADPPEPTQMAVDMALSRIWARARETEVRRFYLYFSGHGQAKGPLDVALCLANWSQMFRHAALSSQQYQEFLMKCTPFAEVVMFLDCCRVRSVDATGKASELGCPVALDEAGAKRTLIAYAAEFQNAAFEAEMAATGVVDEEGPIVRGHFTEALLAGLWGGAARPGGGVTEERLTEYLEVEVPRIASEHGHVQIPYVDSSFLKTDQPVFGTALPNTNVRIAFSTSRRGRIRLEGPELEVVREDDVATGPWELTLEKGRHRLEELNTGDVLDIPFRPAEGVTDVAF